MACVRKRGSVVGSGLLAAHSLLADYLPEEEVVNFPSTGESANRRRLALRRESTLASITENEFGGKDSNQVRRFSTRPTRHNLRKTSLWNISTSSLGDNKLPPPTKCHTYQLEPKQDEKFLFTRHLQKDYEKILQNHLEGVGYCHSKVVYLTESISDAIKARSKLEHAPRYKFIVYVALVENYTRSSIMQANRCLWNTSTDKSCTVQYRCSSLQASATVFAIYTD